MIKIILINIGLFIGTLVLFQITAFAFGYLSNDNHIKEEKILLGVLIFISLLINFFINRKMHTTSNMLVISSIFLVLLYVFLLMVSPL